MPTTLKRETWQQDPRDSELWSGENGLVLNTAALEARTWCYDVLKIPARSVVPPERQGRLEQPAC